MLLLATRNFTPMIRVLLSYIVLFLLINSPCAAAATDTTTTVNWRKPRFFFQFDGYNSFVANRGANCFGIKGGLEFGKQYRFGLGLYTLTSDIIETKVLNENDAKDALNDTVKAQLKMTTVPLSFEYIFFNKGPWQLSVPVNLGLGSTYFSYLDKAKKQKHINKHFVMDTEVAVTAQYKFLRWFGVGAGLGYRLMLVDNPARNYNFNSPIYTVKLKLFLGEIYRSVFPNKKEKR